MFGKMYFMHGLCPVHLICTVCSFLYIVVCFDMLHDHSFDCLFTGCMIKEWLESRYPMLAGVIKTTKTSESFHLAEENKEDFPHDDVRYIYIYCTLKD